MKKLLFLFFPLICLGQSFSPMDLPWFSGGTRSTGFDPTQASAVIRYWWHSGDLPVLNVNVTNWVDRIQSSVWTNGADSLRPTNSSTGVGWIGTTWLSNTVPFNVVTDGTKNTGSVYVVYAPVTAATALGGMISDTTSGGNGLYTTSGSQIKYFGAGGSGTALNYASGTLFDMAMVITNTSAGQNLFYTNSLFINNNAGRGDTGNKTTFLGKDGEAGAVFYKGKMLDLIYYYGVLTQTDINNLHRWATNTYGFSP